MAALETVRHFDIDDAVVTLWTFRGPTGPALQEPKYMGRWVGTTADVDEALKLVFQEGVAKIEETKDYSLLEENHDTSALLITVDETHAGYIIEQSAAETQNKRSSKQQHIENSKFYVAKFSCVDAVTYAVRKTDLTWEN